MNPDFIYAEPIIAYPEKEFEMALRIVISNLLQSRALKSAVPRFGLDIAFDIIDPHQNSPTHLEIEVKAYKGQRQGGVEFGNKKGGSQVDLLLTDANELIEYEKIIRWAFVDATMKVGTRRYALITCIEARDAVMGSVCRGKQNNFKMSSIKMHQISWPDFIQKLSDFLIQS